MAPTLTAGLIICALLGAVDVAGLAGLGVSDGPPLTVIFGGALLGLITLAGLPSAWRGHATGLGVVVGSRLAACLFGVPAFFIDDTPGWARIFVAASFALTAVAIALIWAGRRMVEVARP